MTLGEWLDSVSSAYGFKNRVDFLSDQGIESQNLLDLCRSPSDDLLKTLASRSMLSGASLSEMTVFCFREVGLRDMKMPNFHIGIINQASNLDEVSQIEKLIFSGAKEPHDACCPTIVEIEDIFIQLRAEGRVSFVLYVCDLILLPDPKPLLDLSYKMIKADCGINIIKNGLAIVNRASYLALKYAYIHSFCDRLERGG